MFLIPIKSCEVSIHQNKTLYKRLFNMSAKMEQTDSIMKIYFQLCRGAAHFRCLMQTHPRKKETYSPDVSSRYKGNKKTSFRKRRMKFFIIILFHNIKRIISFDRNYSKNQTSIYFIIFLIKLCVGSIRDNTSSSEI